MTTEPKADSPPPSGTWTLPPPLFDDKVVRGKDGRLFLDHDSNYVMRQHAGTGDQATSGCAGDRHRDRLERFLIKVPADNPSPSLAELAVQKRARGEIRPPGASRGDQWRAAEGV